MRFAADKLQDQKRQEEAGKQDRDDASHHVVVEVGGVSTEVTSVD
jgi:hypothetical protein